MTLLAAPVVVLSAGIAAAAPSITVDPTGGLAAGTTVTVTATGFTPGTTVVVAECRPDESGKVLSPQQCADPSTGSSVVVVVDQQGSLKASLPVTVGDIRAGVSCTADACVVGAISTASTADQALAPVTLTGAGTSLPAPTTTPAANPSPTPTPSGSATSSSQPSTTPSTAPTSETPTVEPATVAPASSPAGNGGGKPRNLAKTGPEDAGRSLLVGLVALQLGLIVAARTRRARPAGVVMTGGGRHRR